MPDDGPRAAFLEMIARPDAEIDLVRSALLIAQEEYPDLDLAGYTSRLDEMGSQARPHVAAVRGNPFAAIDGLNSYLFDALGFRGNTEEYFDPRNSFLNEVLDRKRGIPITLSLIYMEVGARAGLPVEGVGFPGHFLVRHIAGERRIFIDPFHQGMIVTPEDCRRRLAATYGEKVHLETRFLEPAGRRKIVARLLHNLRGIYMKAGDHRRALGVIERLLALEPGDAGLLRDRGLAHMRLSHHGHAVADLEDYLRLHPAAADAPAVRRHVISIRRLTASLN